MVTFIRGKTLLNNLFTLKIPPENFNKLPINYLSGEELIKLDRHASFKKALNDNCMELTASQAYNLMARDLSYLKGCTMKIYNTLMCFIDIGPKSPGSGNKNSAYELIPDLWVLLLI